MIRKKILIFLHKFPYPDNDSTKFRILNSVILPLRQYFDIKIFVVTYENIKKEDLIFLKNIAPLDFYIFPKWRFFLNILLNLFSLRPFQTEMWFFKRVFLRFQEEAKKFDVIYIHTVRLGKYIEKLSPELREKIILDFNDSIAMHYLNGWKYYPWYLKFGILFEGYKLYFYEKLLLKILNNFTIVSEVDKEFILKNVKEDYMKNKNFIVTYISAKVKDIEKSNVVDNKDTSKYICFMGNLRYYPNREGIIHFLKDIWPFIKREFKDLEFLIIGDVDNSLKKKFKKINGVKFLGFVADPTLIILKSLAFVSPVRIGAGLQGKIVEAMGLGQIVICYYLNIKKVNGFEDRKNIILCKDFNPTEWVEALKFIINNREEAEKIKKIAKNLTLTEFTPQKVWEKYFFIFKNVSNYEK